jgi:DNA invertase Pin-like site-specific DNA recombinase
MEGYIGYIRVSTVKQGTKGVSLQEQKDAILRYAERNQLSISTWLEEMETAAKQGRPVFNQALKLLRTEKAKGIILHKLDRGARNLRDWAAIGELSDQGVEVHFVSESLDLQSRGGRLSADIQAVVAADYIRNLREETRKGFYGRLKQGLYPLRAPVGYLDQGKGKPKTIDPIMGPLVRKTFDLYASGRYSLETLGDQVNRLGLRNRHGGRVTRNGLSTLLNNPFYIGAMVIHKTGESFAGIHEPIIGKTLFDSVQAVLSGKVSARSQHHAHLYRRTLSCATCHYSLIGERQKGNVYYRCHSKQCSGTSVRE